MVLLGLIEGGYVRWVDTNSSYLVKRAPKWAFMAFTRYVKIYLVPNYRERGEE